MPWNILATRASEATGTLRFQCLSGQHETFCSLWEKPGWFPAWATFHHLFIYIIAWLHASISIIHFKRHLRGFYMRHFKRWLLYGLLKPPDLRQVFYTLNSLGLLFLDSLIHMCSSKNLMCIVEAKELVETTWQKICSLCMESWPKYNR